MGSFIDGFHDMAIRVSIKFSLIHVVLVIRVKNLVKKYYLLLILNKNLNVFKSGSFCFGLLYPFKSIWPVIYGYWYSEIPVALSSILVVSFLLLMSNLLFWISCWEGNSRRKWGEFGMGGFDEIVISSLWYEKNICSCQKNIAIIKINVSVHPDWWFLLSDSIIYYYWLYNYFSCTLWQWSFERGKSSCDTIGKP